MAKVETKLGIVLFGPNFAAATLRAIRRALIPSWKPPYYPGCVVLLLTNHTAALLERYSIGLEWDRYCDHLEIIPVKGEHGTYARPPYEAGFVAAVLSAVNLGQS